MKAAVPPGTFAYVCYDGSQLYHERSVAAWVNESRYVIVSPDHDLLLEQLDGNKNDLSGLRFGDESGNLSIGLAPGAKPTRSRPAHPACRSPDSFWKEPLSPQRRRHALKDPPSRAPEADPNAFRSCPLICHSPLCHIHGRVGRPCPAGFISPLPHQLLENNSTPRKGFLIDNRGLLRASPRYLDAACANTQLRGHT